MRREWCGKALGCGRWVGRFWTHRPSISNCSPQLLAQTCALRRSVTRRRPDACRPWDPDHPSWQHPSQGALPVSAVPGYLLRHDGMVGGMAGAESSRSLRGLAASSSQVTISRSSLRVGLAPEAARSRSASSTAHASTYKSSCNASSSDLAITNSPSLSSSSCARCRATQSHCRQRCEQNSLGRPGPFRSGSTLLHHRHRPSCVMTKWYPAGFLRYVITAARH